MRGLVVGALCVASPEPTSLPSASLGPNVPVVVYSLVTIKGSHTIHPECPQGTRRVLLEPSLGCLVPTCTSLVHVCSHVHALLRALPGRVLCVSP